ncbi:alpha/beta hydrolase [Aeromicrobium halocynthiae]|uniref:alpha/beta hydrolase n=1 Tax=Aeromicrobium halocynthiae TaxID=560557 RepID=UPI0031DCFCE3
MRPDPSEPRLDVRVRRPRPRAIVLLLHGGQQTSQEPVRDRHASWWRMAMLARALRRTARRERWEVRLLQNAVRGWNDPRDPSPVRAARWALERLAHEAPGTPVVLVGHSMGGRTACRVADDDAVLGVVGLAPWLPQGEPATALRGKALRVLHGTADRWTSSAASRSFVDRCRAVGVDATWTALPDAGHFMFRRVGTWNAFVEDSVLDLVGPSDHAPTRDPEIP